MDENDKRLVEDWIKKAGTKIVQFQTKKWGDTPTDGLQLTPRNYVNFNGTRALRPKIVSPGQQYFSTQDKYPWFTDGVSSWFSATGSVVSAL